VDRKQDEREKSTSGTEGKTKEDVRRGEERRGEERKEETMRQKKESYQCGVSGGTGTCMYECIPSILICLCIRFVFVVVRSFAPPASSIPTRTPNSKLEVNYDECRVLCVSLCTSFPFFWEYIFFFSFPSDSDPC